MKIRWRNRWVIALLLIIMGALLSSILSWQSMTSQHDNGYEVIAEWPIAAGGQGSIIAVGPNFTSEQLRRLGRRFHERFTNTANAVVMIFDNAEAARTVRRGSQNVDENRFQSALTHQRAMYLKVSGGREDSLTIYKSYPTVSETIRFGE